MFEKIHPGVWMALPKDIKEHLVSVFNIQKTGGVHVVDNEVVSDGYTAIDLSVITPEKLAEYIGSEETFPRAWELACMKAKYELYPPVALGDIPVEATQPEEIIEPKKKTHGSSEKNK